MARRQRRNKPRLFFLMVSPPLAGGHPQRILRRLHRPRPSLLSGSRYYNFQVAPADFVGYTNNWYLLNPDGKTAQTGSGTTPIAVINVQDPSLVVGAWDFTQATM